MNKKFLTPKEKQRRERDAAIVAEAAKMLAEEPTLRVFRVATFIAPKFSMTVGNCRRILEQNRTTLNFQH